MTGTLERPEPHLRESAKWPQRPSPWLCSLRNKRFSFLCHLPWFSCLPCLPCPPSLCLTCCGFCFVPNLRNEKHGLNPGQSCCKYLAKRPWTIARVLMLCSQNSWIPVTISTIFFTALSAHHVPMKAQGTVANKGSPTVVSCRPWWFRMS